MSLSHITVHCIGNAHIDPVWRWSWQEGYAEVLATCRAALDRLRETEDFVFSRGQAATYAWIKEADPEVFDEIRRYVAEGRWRIVNGWWEQPDANIPCGESYIRHALYGKRWFREKLGVDVTVGWNVDTFGHNAGLPQILAKSGFTTYCFFRPGPHEKALPGPYFWWHGADGSRVLAIRPTVGHYGTGGSELTDLIRRAAEDARDCGMKHAILFYGVGNHGGGPTRDNIASIRAVREIPGGPNAVFSSVEAFVECISERLFDLPAVADDLQHHAPGCYTTHSGIKRWNRQAENRLLRAERWCALAALALGRSFPAGEFAHAWKQVLFNQFHDILAGTSLPQAYDDAREQIGEAYAIAARQQNSALQALASQIDTRVDDTDPPAASPGRPVLLFNPSSWARTDPVTVQWGWRGESEGVLLDDAGAEVPFQFAQPDIFGGGSRIRFEASIPPHGWRVYRLIRSESHVASRESQALSPRVGETWLENAFVRMEFDAESGCLVRLLDKRNGVEALNGPACALIVMNDPGDTWGHGIAAWREEAGRFGQARFQMVENGPACATLRIETRWGDSMARQEFTLYRECPRVDVTLTVDWRERHRMLKLSVPVAIREGTLTYDAPYSVIVRQANGHEDPGQTWVDLSGISESAGIPFGMSLLNDGKYGFDCLGSDMRMSLLRSPIFCFHDPAKVEDGREYLYMDQGEQTLRYALLPHAGDWSEAGTPRQAFAQNNPLEYVFQYPHAGAWGASGSLLKVEPSNVVAAAMKGAEEGEDLILRLFETDGQAARTVVTLPGGTRLETAMGAWELKTLRLSRDGTAREVSLLEE